MSSGKFSQGFGARTGSFSNFPSAQVVICCGTVRTLSLSLCGVGILWGSFGPFLMRELCVDAVPEEILTRLMWITSSSHKWQWEVLETEI